jgi:drug/metabolite transporter (DMT)-like permease
VHTGPAVGAALGAALCFALSSVLQQRGASRAPEDCGRWLVLHLLRRPVWVAGLAAAVATLVLQFVALAFGELGLIQPLMLLGLLFALPLSVLLEKCRPSPREWAWALLLVAGLSVFLAAARPRPGRPVADDSWILGLAGAFGLVIAVLIGLATGPARRHRAALLGLATGIGYGVSAALMKYTYGLASESPSRLLTSWPGYTLLVVGGASVFLNQLAYRSGPLAGALPPLAIADPVVAVVFGVAAFDESLRTGGVAVAVQVLAVVVVVVAIVRLAQYAAGRHPHDPHRAPDPAGRREASTVIG